MHLDRLLLIGPLPPPHIGPAAATSQLLNSKILQKSFAVHCLDIGDRSGLSGIGQLNVHNIFQALYHYKSFIKCMISYKPTIIYISIARGFWGFFRDAILIIIANFFKIPTIVHLRSGRFDVIHDNGWIGKFIAKRSLAKVARVLVLSENLRHIFQDTVDSHKIRIISNGIDAERLNDGALSIDRSDNAPFTVLCLSNMFHDKGIHVLIEAAALLVEKNPLLQMIFAGSWLNSEYEEHCNRLIDYFNLQKNIRLVGVVTGQEKKELLRSADVVAFVPIKPEGMPWVVLEAMAAAKPVVGTPQGAMVEMIRHGETGFLVQPEDPQQLSEAIFQLMQNSQLRTIMGNNARKRIEENYSTAITHQQLVSVLQEVINGGKNN